MIGYRAEHTSKPRPTRASYSAPALAQSRPRNAGLFANPPERGAHRSDARGHEDAVNMYCRQQNRRTSNFGWSDATKPPTAPRLLLKVPATKSTLCSTLGLPRHRAVRSEHADRMGLVDQEVRAVPLLHPASSASGA